MELALINKQMFQLHFIFLTQGILVFYSSYYILEVYMKFVQACSYFNTLWLEVTLVYLFNFQFHRSRGAKSLGCGNRPIHM
jgi:hypothetical protein